MSKRTPKGMGSVLEYRPGKYRTWLDLGVDEYGKRLRKTFSGNTQEEVVKKLDEFKEEKRKGTIVLNDRTTFHEFANRWLETKETQVKASTYESYKNTCTTHFFPALGRRAMQKITTAQINDFLQKKMSSGLAPASVARLKAILHAIFNLAVREGLVGRNVIEATSTIKREQKETFTLSVEDIDKILKTAEAYDQENWAQGKKTSAMYHLILLAISTGCRRGELLGLKWNAVDATSNIITIRSNLVEVYGKIHIETPKTRSSKRTIALDKIVLDKLLELKDKHEVKSPWVFHNRLGEHLFPSNVGRSFDIIRKRARLPHIRFHDLRHTHATLLIAHGVDMKTVSERIGHEDIRTTLNLYTHALPQKDREAAELIGKLMNPHEVK